MDRLLPKSKRDFYIELHENKYYFPGDIIKGTVVLNLDKATRTNHIRITLTGIVKTDGNNKKNSAFHHHGHMATALNANQLQVLTLPPLFVAQEEKTLAAQSHRFPFEFQLPNTEPLPSSLKLKEKNKRRVKMRIRYLVTALLDRPLIPDYLARQTKKELRVLERIDVTRPEYNARSHVVKTVYDDDEKKKAIKAALSLPRYAVTRGDILRMTLSLDHYRDFARDKGIKVQLIRRVYSGKTIISIGKNRRLAEQKTIKSFTLDVKVPTSSKHQTIDTKLLIPTDTPPTISSDSGRVLSVEYAIRATINLNNSLSLGTITSFRPGNQIELESNFVVGTYPYASVSIEDDSDDDDMDDDDDDDEDDDDDDDDRSSFSNDSIALEGDRTTKPLPSPSMTSSTSTTTTNSTHIIEPSPTTRLSSSATVVDPTALMKKMTLHQTVDPTRRPTEPQRHSPKLPGFSSTSSSLTIIDPTHSPARRHSQIPASSHGTSTVVDPTLARPTSHMPYLHHRHASSVSTLSSTSSSTTSSSTTTAGSVTTIEPGQRYDLKKPDTRLSPTRGGSVTTIEPPRYETRKPDTRSPSMTFTSSRPPQPMASMPDIFDYMPAGTSSPKKRPALHIHPVSPQHHQQLPPYSSPTPRTPAHYPHPSPPAYYSPACPSSPGGFIVPQPYRPYPTP